MRHGEVGHAASSGNRLLDAIVRRCPALRSELEPVGLPAWHEVQAAQARITHVWFPVAGAMAVIVRASGGKCAEALAIGRDGMAGLPVWFGLADSPHQVLQQLPGAALRVRSPDFCDLVSDDESVHMLLQRYAAHCLVTSFQNTACSLHHDVEQRLCRWLLTLADRGGGATLALTQGLLATTIGARRQSVSDVVVRLQHDGLIEHRRAVLRIVDRRGLEARACGCYRVLRQHERATIGTLL